MLLKRGREFYLKFALIKMIKRKRVAGPDEIQDVCEKPMPFLFDFDGTRSRTGVSAPHGLRCGLYITGGTVMPIRARVRINSRRAIATVASRNCLRFSSDSFKIGWR